jgi:hypothetical protein
VDDEKPGVAMYSFYKLLLSQNIVFDSSAETFETFETLATPIRTPRSFQKCSQKRKIDPARATTTI